MTIRTLAQDDAPAWWHLRMESLELEPHAFGKSVAEHKVTPMQMIADRLKRSNADYFTLGAFTDDILVGMATYMRNTGAKDRHKGNLYGVYVTPGQRGRGISKQLITTLIDMAKRDPSLEQLILAVGTRQEAAKRLYRSAGFKTFGTEPYALKVGDEYVEEDHMILRISKA